MGAVQPPDAMEKASGNTIEAALFIRQASLHCRSEVPQEHQFQTATSTTLPFFPSLCRISCVCCSSRNSQEIKACWWPCTSAGSLWRKTFCEGLPCPCHQNHLKISSSLVWFQSPNPNTTLGAAGRCFLGGPAM